jgi:hypothetical protein
MRDLNASNLFKENNTALRVSKGSFGELKIRNLDVTVWRISKI